MTEELFSYAYPMADDVAQSMLISETETRIHIRPTSNNALITWLHNKLIRNLLTSRKTLVLVSSQEQVRMLEDIIQTYEIQSLCLFFNHSRSDIEKKLLQFKPMTVQGKLQIKGFENASADLTKKVRNMLDSIQHSHVGSHETPASMVNILARYIQINSSNELVFEPTSPALSQKEYLQLKQLLEQFARHLKGNLDPNHALTELNTRIFELFLAEEAWTCIEQNLNIWIQSGRQLLHECLLLISEYKQSESSRIRFEIKSIQDEISIHKSIQSSSNVHNIELQLLEEKLHKVLKSFAGESGMPSNAMTQTPHSWSEKHVSEYLSQYLEIKFQHIPCEEVRSTALNKSANTFLIKFQDWLNEINSAHILKDSKSFDGTDLVSAAKYIKSQTATFLRILEGSQDFENYFEWSILYSRLTQAQACTINILVQHSPQHWQSLLDGLYLYNIVERNVNATLLPDHESTLKLKQGLDELKSQLPTYLHSRYENYQYHALRELENSQPTLHETLVEKKPSPNSLSEHYHQTPLLSEVFPVIVMEVSHPEYFPANLVHVWDEIWNLCPDIEETFLTRFEKAGHRYISIFEDHAPNSHFQIALSQAPPLRLLNILNHYSSSEGWTLMSQLALFIQSNFPNFRLYANSEYHCLSFLPKGLEQLVLQWSQSEWQNIPLEESTALDKLTEILLFKGTKKKIWNCDGLYSNTTSGIQQLEWHWHFGRCMEAAGFECETIWSNKLYEYRNFLKITDTSIPNKRSTLPLLKKA